VTGHSELTGRFNPQELGEVQGEPDARYEPVIRSHRRLA